MKLVKKTYTGTDLLLAVNSILTTSSHTTEVSEYTWWSIIDVLLYNAVSDIKKKHIETFRTIYRVCCYSQTDTYIYTV